MERIIRARDHVHRPAGAWTKSVHRLLLHLHDNGFAGAPEPIALGDTRETVTFVPGDAGEYPWTDDLASEAALVTTARLLRAYHDTAASFVPTADDIWSLPERQPVETICHGDFAPYNCVYVGRTAHGIIDFDTAHPGPRVWDVASAVYRFAPFTVGPVGGASFNFEERLQRAARFCDAYELDARGRNALTDTMLAGLTELIVTIEREASAGNPKFVSDLAHGHLELYRADSDLIAANADAIATAVR